MSSFALQANLHFLSSSRWEVSSEETQSFKKLRQAQDEVTHCASSVCHGSGLKERNPLRKLHRTKARSNLPLSKPKGVLNIAMQQSPHYVTHQTQNPLRSLIIMGLCAGACWRLRVCPLDWYSPAAEVSCTPQGPRCLQKTQILAILPNTQR